MNQPEPAALESKRPLLSRFVEFLICPPATIAGPEERQKARLAAGATFATALLSTAALMMTIFIGRPSITAALPLGPFIAAAWAAYILTRTRVSFLGSFILAAALCEAPFLSSLAGASALAAKSFVIFVPMGLILGSYLLNIRWLAVLLGLAASGFLLPPWADTRAEAENAGTFAAIIATGLMLILIAVQHDRQQRASADRVAALGDELAELANQFETRVSERTVALNRRAAELEASSFVSRQTASILEPAALLDQVVQLVSDTFGYYHAGIFLLDTSGRFAVLQAASSAGGKRMLARGHRLEVGREGIVGYAAYQKRARIALDVGEEAVFFSNPDLPETRSEMALPLAVRGRVLGVLDVQSTEPGVFGEEEISALQTLADQIALALDNARLLAESRVALQHLQTLSAESSYRAWRQRLSGRSTAFCYTPLGVRSVELRGAASNPARGEDLSTLRVPISLHGREIGALTLQRKGKEQEWSDADRDLAGAVSNQVALALGNARLLEDLQERAQREQALARAASQLSQTTDLEKLLQLALREFHQLPSVEDAAIVLGRVGNGQFVE